MNKTFTLLMCCTVLQALWAQKEYHFYSDQPEVRRLRVVQNDYQYHAVLLENTLYVHLKLALAKKRLAPSQAIVFEVKVSQRGQYLGSQTISTAYYDFDGSHYSFKLPVKVLSKDTLMELALSNRNPELIGSTDFKVSYDFSKSPEPSVVLYDGNMEPVVAEGLVLNQNVVPMVKQGPVYVRCYEYPAQEPRVLRGSGSRKHKVPSSFQIPSQSSRALYKEGYYEFSGDSLFSSPRALQVNRSGFPRMNRVSELLGPLAYLTDSASYGALLQDASPKKALDGFWLQYIGSKEVAKRVIKAYYARVYEANRGYNDRLLGWKSDMGMAHILFGKPLKVVMVNDTLQKWAYASHEVNFVKRDLGVYEFEDFKSVKPLLLLAADNIKKGDID